MVRVVFALSVKSPASAGLSGAAETVTVVSSLEAWDNAAVTVLTPPFSLIKSGVSASVTVGVPSLSIRVTAAGVTVSPLTVPPMLSVSGPSASVSSLASNGRSRSRIPGSPLW